MKKSFILILALLAGVLMRFGETKGVLRRAVFLFIQTDQGMIRKNPVFHVNLASLLIPSDFDYILLLYQILSDASTGNLVCSADYKRSGKADGTGFQPVCGNIFLFSRNQSCILKFGRMT